MSRASPEGGRSSTVPGLAAGALIVGVALFVGLDGLGDRTVWLDEAHTFLRARLPVPDLIAESIRKRHVPTYFLFMHHWLALGDSEVMLRLPSVFFGLAGVAAAGVFGLLLGGVRTGIATSALLAVAPWHVRYLQEARMYTMLAFAATIALCGALFLVREPERAARPRMGKGDAAARRAWLAIVCGTVAAMYLHNTGVLFAGVVFGAAGLGLARRAGTLRNLGAAGGLVLLGHAPWLPTLVGQSAAVGDRGWGDFSVPEVTSMLETLYLLDRWTSPFAWIVAAALAVGAAGLLRTAPGPARFALAAFVGGPLIFLAASFAFTPMFLPRAMLWSMVPALALVGAGLARIRSGAAFAAVLVLLVGYRVAVRAPSHDHGVPNRAIAEQLANALRAGDAVVLVDGLVELPLRYYAERRSDPIKPLAWVSLTRRDIRRPARRLSDAIGHAGHVWLVVRERSSGDLDRLRAWLGRRGEQVFAERHRTTVVEHYAMGPPAADALE